MPLFVKITRIPFRLLTACPLVVCFSGGYAIANRSFDVKVMVVMGIVAICSISLNCPQSPCAGADPGPHGGVLSAKRSEYREREPDDLLPASHLHRLHGAAGPAEPGRTEAARSENILALLTGPRILICKNDRLSAVIFAVLHWAIYIYSIAALRLCAPPGQSFSSGA